MLIKYGDYYYRIIVAAMKILLFSLTVILLNLKAQDIPIKEVVIFMPQIQTYSAAFSIDRQNQESSRFTPKVDRQFYVRHWQQNLHNQQQEQLSKGKEQEVSSKKESRYIDKIRKEGKKDQLMIYRYCLIAVFVLLVCLHTGRKKIQYSQRIQIEEEDQEISNAI